MRVFKHLDRRAVVASQLAELLLPTPKVQCSSPAGSNFDKEHSFACNLYRKDDNKRGWEWQIEEKKHSDLEEEEDPSLEINTFFWNNF